MQQSALVIGAGFGGLSAALRLRARGLSVTVVDGLSGPGGRGVEFVRSLSALPTIHFRYDAGPTVLTAPVLFEELFTLFGETLSNYVELLPVTPWYQMRFVDGTQLNYGGTTAEIQREIAKFSAQDAQAYPVFLAFSQRLFEKGYEDLGTQPFLGWKSMLRAAPAMARLRADRSVYALTAKYFKDERIRRAFSIQPLLVGGNPFDTTSIYSLIHALERKWGVWFVRGGMATLARALVALGERHGVRFEWGAEVTKINTAANRASGVSLQDGRQLLADTVVCNADPGYVLSKLLDGAASRPRAVADKKYSMGLFVWYFSTKRIYTEVPHHTILFGHTYRKVLDKIFNSKELPDDLSIYLHRPSATDSQYAPPGYDSFYALVPVPNLQANIDWTLAGEAFKNALCSDLQARILPDLAESLVDDFYLTPQYFADQLHSPHGAGFSITPNLMQSAGFRFPNRNPDLANLYFVGAGTHPGAGVPGVVTSAKVMERLMFGNVA
jgi:phytoene desaturase